MKPSHIADALELAIDIQQPVFVWGAPGVGKSDAVDEFCANYDGYVADARIRLNGLFNEADYPGREKIRLKFAFGVSVLPMPSADDFRVNLADSEVSRIREQITEDINAAVQDAQRDAFQRLYDAVSSMSERLNAYSVDSNGKVSGIFRDSLVGNLVDLADVLPKLNITGDARLTELVDTVKDNLLQHSAQQLRDNSVARKSVAASAAAIMAQMSGYMSGFGPVA